MRLILAQSMSRPVSFSRHSRFHSVAESQSFLYMWKCRHISGIFSQLYCLRGVMISKQTKKMDQNLNLSRGFYMLVCCLLLHTVSSCLFFRDSVLAVRLSAPLVYLNRPCESYCASTLQLETVQEVPDVPNTISPTEAGKEAAGTRELGGEEDPFSTSISFCWILGRKI